MKRLLVAATGALYLTGCSPVSAQAPATSAPAPATATTAADTRDKLAARGVQRFTFSGWGGPALPVWYLRTVDTPADAPILFVFHGVRRDADRYISEWIDIAAREKLVVVVPEFSSASFPGARGYNHGNVLDEAGAATPVAQRSFAAIEPLFDTMRAREGLTRPQYWLFGHSAGAQFAHRFVMTGHAKRMERAVSANAGSYMFPDTRYRWPFGTGGLPEGIWTPEAAYSTRMTVLLGTADNDPNYPSLPRDPEAMAQGPHRLARGHAFFAAARADATKRGVVFAWSCALAPGIGHDNGGMAPFALAVLKEQSSVISCPD